MIWIAVPLSCKTIVTAPRNWVQSRLGGLALRKLKRFTGTLGLLGVLSVSPHLLSGVATHAQTLPLGTLVGTVTDPSGAVILNASIYLAGMGREETGQTDRAGRFSFHVAPGTYTIQVESDGFERFTSHPLAVRANLPVRLPVQLAVAARNEQIDVDTLRSGSTEPGENGSALIFSGDKLSMLSDDPATLAQQINALAGPGLGGSTQILVNGFTGGRIPPKAAIRSISVNQNPYSAYYDTPGFGRLEIDTKPGADKFHGALDFAGTDQPLNARNPFTAEQPPFYQFQTDSNLTGPINRKTAFFAAQNVVQLANNAVVNALVLDGGLQPGAVSTAVPAPQLTQTYSLRVDRQFSAKNFGFLRNEWSRTHTTNDGLSPLLLPSAAFASTTLTNTLQAADTQLLGPHAVNETRFQYLRTRVRQDPNSTQTGLLVQGAFQSFGSTNQFLRDNADRYELQDRLELDRGHHSLRAGFRFRELRDANNSTANFNGQYVFNSISAYQLTAANLQACATPGTGGGCLGPEQLRAQGGGASQFSITTGQPAALLHTADVGAYAEDDWRVSRDVTLSYGLRLESQSAVPDHFDPAPRVGVAWAVHHGKSPTPLVVLRTGYGIFYTRFPAGSLLRALRQDGVAESGFFSQNPDTFTQGMDGSPIPPPLSQLTASEPTVFRVNPQLRSAYNQVASFGADRYLGRRGVVSASFLYAHGAHEYLLRNVNAPLPGTFSPDLPGSGTRPLGGTQNIYQYSSDSNENDELFSTNTQLQATKRLFLFVSYILQRQAGETTGPNSFPSDQYNLRADYARDSGLYRQFLNSAVFWKLPRDYGIAMFFNAHSGAPFDITTGTDRNGDTIFNDRPAFATDLTRASVVRTRFGDFDTAPLLGQNLIPRNYATAPPLFWVDLQGKKSFHLGPRPPSPAAGAAEGTRPAAAPARPDRPWELRFQVDAQNVLNHTNPGLPLGVLPSPGEPLCAGLTSATACSYFGRSLSQASDFSPLTASNRTILLQALFTF